ncbi:MAG: hypothetical protein LBE91_01270 [Tannerella sp.]|jgi:LEA14-like dessication related protein|nr:hypothetical protein [Tannerella sp.]
MKKTITMITILMLFAGLQTISALTYTVEVPAGTPMVYVWNWTSGWVFMDRVSENKFACTIDNADISAADECYYSLYPDWRTPATEVYFAGWEASHTITSFPDNDFTTFTVQVPPQTKEVYFSNWNTSWNLLKMQQVGANTFSIDISSADVTDYSYCAGPDWAYQEADAGGNPVSHNSWLALDIAADFMDYYDPFPPLTYTVEVPAATKVLYIVGEATGNKFIEMQRVGAENKFTVTLQNVDANMDYAYCAGPGWEYQETDGNGIAVNHTQHSASDVATDFEDYFDPAAPTTLTYTVEVPAEVKALYIMGDVIGTWDSWVEMEREGSKFTITLDNVSADMDYGYCAGPGRDYEETDAGGNPVVHNGWSASDIAVAFEDYYDPDAVPQGLTYTVEVPEGTRVVYIIGDMNEWTEFVAMQKVNGENKFTITLENVSKDMDYEYCAGPGWEYEEINADGKPVNHSEWLELDVAVGFMDYFDPSTLTTLTYTVEVPAETKTVYIVGDATGGWSDFVEMQRVGTENKFTITLENVNSSMDYEYCAGPGWEYEEIDTDGKPVAHSEWLPLDIAVGFKDYFDPSTLTTLTYTVEVPAETKTVYIVGDVTGGWSDFVEMQRVGTENKFTITLENVNSSMDYEYCAGPGWNYEEINTEGKPVAHSEWLPLDVAVGFMDYYDPVGTEYIKDNTGLVIYSVNQVIVVKGIFRQVNVYNLAGQIMQSEKAKDYFESKPLNDGIYIIQTDRQAGKVIVR